VALRDMEQRERASERVLRNRDVELRRANEAYQDASTQLHQCRRARYRALRLYVQIRLLLNLSESVDLQI
jgi:hypothetical protein